MSTVDEFQVADIRNACGECGMVVAPAAYHPYAACLMFKGCHDGSIVSANLDAVRAHGAQYDSGFDDWADARAWEKSHLWAFLRSVLLQGQAIALDYLDKGYELMSARVDEAARELEAELEKHRYPQASDAGDANATGK